MGLRAQKSGQQSGTKTVSVSMRKYPAGLDVDASAANPQQNVQGDGGRTVGGRRWEVSRHQPR